VASYGSSADAGRSGVRAMAANASSSARRVQVLSHFREPVTQSVEHPIHAQQFPVALSVDVGGDQLVHADDTAVLAHLEYRGVGRHERVRTAIKPAGAKCLDSRDELGGDHRHVRLGKRCDTRASAASSSRFRPQDAEAAALAACCVGNGFGNRKG